MIIVIPQCLRGISSRTRLRCQNPWMLKPQSQPSILAVLQPWSQPTPDRVALQHLLKKLHLGGPTQSIPVLSKG